MRSLDRGHTYELENLKTTSTTIIKFMKDPTLHNGEGQEGPSCQEYLRAVIDRVHCLNEEKPHEFNNQIVEHLRKALAYFEFRAILLKIGKGKVEIEGFPVFSDGHVFTQQAGITKNAGNGSVQREGTTEAAST